MHHIFKKSVATAATTTAEVYFKVMSKRQGGQKNTSV